MHLYVCVVKMMIDMGEWAFKKVYNKLVYQSSYMAQSANTFFQTKKGPLSPHSLGLSCCMSKHLARRFTRGVGDDF